MIWFTSDQHFYHKNIIPYCNRPWETVEEMNEGLIQRWNEKVAKKYEVFILGDFSFAKPNKTNPILDKLNGVKCLVKGNHDHSTTKWSLHLATSPHDFSIMMAPLVGVQFLVSHYPYKPQDPDEDVRYLERRPLDNGDWLLHGHVHKLYKTRRRIYITTLFSNSI